MISESLWASFFPLFQHCTFTWNDSVNLCCKIESSSFPLLPHFHSFNLNCPRLGTPTSGDAICTAWLGGAAALTLVFSSQSAMKQSGNFPHFKFWFFSSWLTFSSPLSFCILKQAVRMNIVSSYIYFKISFLRYPIISLTSSTLQKTWVVGQVLCQFIKKDYFSSGFQEYVPHFHVQSHWN